MWERHAIEEVDGVVQHLTKRAMLAGGILAVIVASYIWQLTATSTALSGVPSARVLGAVLAACKSIPDSCGLTLPVEPKYVSIDTILSSSPTDPAVVELIKSWFPHGLKKDTEYLYLGYGVEDEADLAALAAQLVEKTEDSGVIPLPIRRRDGRNVLLPISSINEAPDGSAWGTWYRDPSQIPVFIDRGCLQGRGGHVIFLDGSKKYFPYVRGSVWPLTRDGLRSIRTIADPAAADTRK